jgi:hypothetical protein
MKSQKLPAIRVREKFRQATKLKFQATKAKNKSYKYV